MVAVFWSIFFSGCATIGLGVQISAPILNYMQKLHYPYKF